MEATTVSSASLSDGLIQIIGSSPEAEASRSSLPSAIQRNRLADLPLITTPSNPACLKKAGPPSNKRSWWGFRDHVIRLVMTGWQGAGHQMSVLAPAMVLVPASARIRLLPLMNFLAVLVQILTSTL
jgi:hypothetical protein